MGDFKFRTILEENGLTSFDRDSLNLEIEAQLRNEVEIPLTHLPLNISPPATHATPRPLFSPSERTNSGLSQSAPNLKQEARRERTSSMKLVPDPISPPKVRHYDRKDIQEYIHKQKTTRKDKRQ